MISDVLLYLSIFMVLASLVPLIRQDFWFFRVFEYPRLQKLIITIILVIVIVVLYRPTELFAKVVLGALLANLCYLAYLVLPFTGVARKQIIRSKNPPGLRNLSVLIANVLQYNRHSADYHALIKKMDPHVILLVETDQWWEKEMDPISEVYPHQLKVPLSNTYGMLFYSKLPLFNKQVRYLVENDIPSIQTDVRLPSGEHVRLYCLHPKPPVPQENPRSTERDKEILMVAKEAKACELPVIVMGDLNDVAWSYTTKLFGRISGLLDPRRGRGFFNSFNAKYAFVRFPLDHLFCSADFTLTTIRRLPACGSDHFPMFVNLQLDRAAEAENEVPEPTQQDEEIAEEKVHADTN